MFNKNFFVRGRKQNSFKKAKYIHICIDMCKDYLRHKVLYLGTSFLMSLY